MIEKNIMLVQASFWDLCVQHRERLRALSEEQLHDLVHRAEELTISPVFSLRVAAEINKGAAAFILDERKGV